MAKMNEWEKRHQRNMAYYERQIDSIFKSAAREAAAIVLISGAKTADEPFSFTDYPNTRKKVEKLLNGLKNDLEIAIVNGVEAEWTLANNKNSELANRVFGDNVDKLTESQRKKYYTTNDKALQAFKERKENGLNLSDRVWNYTEQFKSEIEMGIECGLRDGLSADEMSRELRDYLRHPDKLFRRVRDEHGVLQLSMAARAFHPGRGVYRSSYKNARRLAVTETNMAYRTADFLRWSKLDFVVGIEICLSNNHTLNGVPLTDICDELKGKYPKDFKFVGWHPHCRCHVVSILKTKEEMAEDDRRLMVGEPLGTGSANEVKVVPKAFEDWIKNNVTRIVRSNRLPYFITDNIHYVTDILQRAQPSSKIAEQMMTEHFWKYVSKFKGTSEKYYDLYRRLSEVLPDSETAIIVNQIKHECANITHRQLLSSGHIGKEWTLSRTEFNAVIQNKKQILSKGKFISLPEVKMDLLIYKDKYGHEFAYPIGADENLFKATIASEAISEFPPYLRKGIKRVSFLDIRCPADVYWKIEYNNPKHKSMATDGGKTTFFLTPSDKIDFKKYMSHEAGHILDGLKHKYSSSAGWQEAVSKDDAIYAKYGNGQHRVSNYAKTNDIEDFAECISMYITDHEYFKKAFPNRAAYIRRIAQELSGHVNKA